MFAGFCVPEEQSQYAADGLEDHEREAESLLLHRPEDSQEQIDQRHVDVVPCKDERWITRMCDIISRILTQV